MSDFSAGALFMVLLALLVAGLWALARRSWGQMPMPDEDPLSPLQASNRAMHRALRRRTPVVRRITVRRGARTVRKRRKTKRR